jgi:hypothetical protein
MRFEHLAVFVYDVPAGTVTRGGDQRRWGRIAAMFVVAALLVALALLAYGVLSQTFGAPPRGGR